MSFDEFIELSNFINKYTNYPFNKKSIGNTIIFSTTKIEVIYCFR